jgi:hypothetical protein
VQTLYVIAEQIMCQMALDSSPASGSGGSACSGPVRAGEVQGATAWPSQLACDLK